MPSRSRLLWMGALGIASCDPTLADYCAPTAPECTRGDGGTPDAALAADSATQDERSADGGQDVSPSSDVSRCDGSKPPHDDPCVINESYGVFVSSGGSDANAGTRASPVLTIGHAVDLGKSAAKRVYVCAGSFGEHLVVGAARDGVSVYGGLDCATWTYGSGNRVFVAPAGPGYALELDGLQAGVTFEDVEFDAPTGVNPGESSIAVFANKSSGVAFHRVTLVADVATDGAAGASGGPNPDGGANADPSNWYGTRPNFPELNGINAGDAGAAPATTCTCTDRSTSTGGQGGGPLNSQVPSGGQPSYSDAGSAGVAGANGAVCGNGGSPIANGADAPVTSAAIPSTAPGALSTNGWTPGIGAAGTAGRQGQGGGGGGNGRLSSGAGGGGACGGCGGAGGKPGLGGGSSIALLSFQSSIALVSCAVTAKAGGNGGTGGSGEPGQPGGSAGAPSGVGVGAGCSGGAGGAGAGGNGAQGGAGGLSLGIGYSGLAPTIDGVLVVQAASQSGIMLGSAGVGGTGGVRGAAASIGTGPAGADGPPGQSGIAMAVRQLP